MMKRLCYILFVAITCVIKGCSSSSEEEPILREPGIFITDTCATYWYYIYRNEGHYTGENFGLLSRYFYPGATCVWGDTVFVANDFDNNLLVYNYKTNTMLKTLNSWTGVDGVPTRFDSRIESIAVSDTRLYVNLRESRILVYQLPSLEFIASIGNGNSEQAVAYGQAMAVVDGKIFVRQKDGSVRVYLERDVVPEKSEKIEWFTCGQVAGEVNDTFVVHQMIVDSTGLIYLSEPLRNQIRVIDPRLVTSDMEGKQNVVIEDVSRLISLDFSVSAFGLVQSRACMIDNATRGTMLFYDLDEGNFVRKFSMLGGTTFMNIERISISGNSFWITDTGEQYYYNGGITCVGVYKGEIREYKVISDSIVRVRGTSSRGDVEVSFLVDLNTHEIIGE